MTSLAPIIAIQRLLISPGHDFKGRHGLGRLENEVQDLNEIELVARKGIRGDRYFDYEPDYKGQLTFFEEEVWMQVKEKFALHELSTSVFRRNVVVSGIELNALIGRRFALGELELTGSEEAKPCYWMDQCCKPGVEEFFARQGWFAVSHCEGWSVEVGELRVAGFGCS